MEEPIANGQASAGQGAQSEVARDQGRQVADEAGTQAREVADTAQQQAAEVRREARAQGEELLQEAQQQLKTQASQQTDRLGGAVDDLGSRLQALADGRPDESGPVGEYAERIAGQTRDIAGRIDELGFEGVLEEVQQFARRRPGAFLIGAAVAGFASSRLARGANEAQSDTSGSEPRPQRQAGTNDGTSAATPPVSTEPPATPVYRAGERLPDPEGARVDTGARR